MAQEGRDPSWLEVAAGHLGPDRCPSCYVPSLSVCLRSCAVATRPHDSASILMASTSSPDPPPSSVLLTPPPPHPLPHHYNDIPALETCHKLLLSYLPNVPLFRSSASLTWNLKCPKCPPACDPAHLCKRKSAFLLEQGSRSSLPNITSFCSPLTVNGT